MYSPGVLKVAVVAAFPSLSSGGLGFSKLTGPGPRNSLQEMLAGGPRRGRATGVCLPSSVTHGISGSASPGLAAKDGALPPGGPAHAGPSIEHLTLGGQCPRP